MKRIYCERKYLCFQEKHALQNEKRRISRKTEIRLERRHYHEDQRRKNIRRSRSSVPIEMKVPALLSISENIIETMGFLKELELTILKRRVVLRFKGVDKCEPDALLYLISIMDRTIIANGFVDVAGDLPDNLSCRESIIESGFFDFVDKKPAYWHPHTNDKVLTIKAGVKTKPTDAVAVVDFVKRHLPTVTHDFLSSFYITLIEMMTNTRAHAFKIRDKSSKWYVMAKVDDGVVQVVFLDGGLGIPETLHKNWYERCQSLLSGLTHSNTDSVLLRSALNGEFRTQTRERYRGKGMPAINTFSRHAFVKDFLLLSRRGIINYSKNEIVLEDSFSGTLYEWLICFPYGGTKT